MNIAWKIGVKSQAIVLTGSPGFAGSSGGGGVCVGVGEAPATPEAPGWPVAPPAEGQAAAKVEEEWTVDLPPGTYDVAESVPSNCVPAAFTRK